MSEQPSRASLREALEPYGEIGQRVLEALAPLDAPSAQLTFEEFLERYDGQFAEWVNGEVIMAGPAGLEHQDISGFLQAVLRAFAEAHGLGKIVAAPFAMRIGGSAREPDVLFVSTEHLARLGETYLDGPADLVIEIVSPESAQRDRGDKYYEYEAAGIPEYWLIDPIRKRAEFYQLDHEGRYQVVLPETDSGVYRSDALADFELKVDWLWDPPPVLDALKHLGLA